MKLESCLTDFKAMQLHKISLIVTMMTKKSLTSLLEAALTSKITEKGLFWLIILCKHMIHSLKGHINYPVINYHIYKQYQGEIEVPDLLEAVLTSKVPSLVCLTKKNTCKHKGHGFMGNIKYPVPLTTIYMNSSREKLRYLTSWRLF